MSSEAQGPNGTCWLVRGDRSRVRVDRRGLLIGRSLGNDILIADPAASSVHALVRLGPLGPEVWSLGRNPTRLDGVAVDRVEILHDGDIVEVPGETLRVEIREAPAAGATLVWTVRLPQGEPLGVARDLVVGGGPDDDVVVEGWPAGAVQFRLAQGSLIVEPRVPVTTAAGPVDPGGMVACRHADHVRLAEGELVIAGQVWNHLAHTALQTTSPLPERVTFSFLRTGGQVVLGYPQAEVVLSFPEVRARLVATLLGGTGAFEPDAWHPDEVVIPSVWPREEAKTRVDVNILVHRVRQDLLKAGLNPFALLEREDRATRFRVAPGATVRVT